MSEFSFESLLDDSAATEKNTRVRLSRIKPYVHNRDLTTPEQIKTIEELSAQLSATNWQLVQPITVQKINDPEFDFMLIAGERRYRAFILGEQEEIDANVFEYEHFSEQQLRELNLVENQQREDEDLFSKAVRYKQYMSDFNIRANDASKRLGIESGMFSKLTNHIVDIKHFELIKELYFDKDKSQGKEKGVRDVILLTALVQIGKISNKSLATLIGFCKANNCLNRTFVLSAKKICTNSDDMDLENNLLNLLSGESYSDTPKKTSKNTKISSDTGHDDTGHDDIGHDDTGHDDTGHDDTGHDDTGSDDFTLESENDGIDKNPKNTSQIDGYEVTNKKITQICVDYEGEKYDIDLTQSIPTKENEGDFLIGIHVITKDKKVLQAEKCSIAFVSA